MLFYLFRGVATSASWPWFWIPAAMQATRETPSGGEFGWGGTSVKE
jgi:hypothetical protein